MSDYEVITHNKRAFDAHIKKLDNEKMILEIAKAQVIGKFKKNCSHPMKQLESKTNDYEDEYGRWTDYVDYDYWCNRCGTKIYKLKKKPHDIAELRKLLNDQNE